jgi:hypothetical protein
MEKQEYGGTGLIEDEVYSPGSQEPWSVSRVNQDCNTACAA